MTDLTVDVDELRTIAGRIRSAAGGVPVHALVDASSSGSGRIAIAGDAFNMWAAVSGQKLAGRLVASAESAEFAASEFERLDQEIADGVS